MTRFRILAFAVALYLSGALFYALATSLPLTGAGPGSPGVSRTWVSVYSSTASTSAGWTGYTLALYIPAAQFSGVTGTAINSRWTVKASSSATTYDSVTVCTQGGANNYSCGAAPTVLQLSGLSTWTMLANSTNLSDTSAYVIPTSGNVVFCAHSVTDSNFMDTTAQGSQQFYIKSGVNECTTQSKSGYSTSSYLRGVVTLGESFQ